MTEKLVKFGAIAIVAVLSSSGAYAWGSSHSTPTSPEAAQYVMPGPPTVVASPGVRQTANECAPDRAEAVWGAAGQLGYACVRPGN